MNERVKHYLKILDFYRSIEEIDAETYANAHAWLVNEEYAEYRQEVMQLIRPNPLIDAFYQILPFGTGGRRGVVGVGSNRLNARTIGESAQGVANHIKEQDNAGELARRGVVVAHDVRNSSADFTRITAEVLAANGIRVYLFDGPRSTPLLSFAVRHLNTIAGVVITASHNPPSDNGFKAYWEDGGQMVAPHDKAVLQQVAAVTAIERLPLDDGRAKGLIEFLDDRVDNAYFAMIREKLTLCDEREATIVYTPLHGSGSTIVPPALETMGFAFHMPEPQTTLDGNFPTVPNNYPNPEIPAALAMAVEMGKQVQADLVCGSDPDADRLGVFVPDADGQFVYLTGNQFQALMLDFVLTRRRALGTLPENPYVITTLVTTKMLRTIAEAHGVEIVDHLLVGFKNIAHEIAVREKAGQAADNLLFASEESIGYMGTAEVRDKDAGAAAVLAAQMTAYYKARGLSLLSRLQQLWQEHGYFVDTQFSVFLEGAAGQQQMRALLDRLRGNPPEKIGDLPVYGVTDRLQDTYTDRAGGDTKTLGYEKSNVLVYHLGEPGSTTAVSIRPSGTEPKIKHYISHHGSYEQRADVQRQVDELVEAFKKLENDILAELD